MSDPRTIRMADTLDCPDVELRVLDADDLPGLHAMFTDPLTHTIGDGPFSSLAQSREWLEGRFQRRREYGVTWYGIHLDGELIGNAGLFMGRTRPDSEIGLEISKDHQGHGYGTAAARAVVAEAHRAGFARVWASVRDWNIASLTALERVGFHRDHTESDETGPLIYLVHQAA